MTSAGTPQNTAAKMDNLKQYLKAKGRIMVAFSGGVDSTFLTAVAREVLGDNVLAVTGDSPTYASEEMEEAKTLTKFLGVRHLIIKTNELTCAEFVQNPPDRCYHCKKELYTLLREIAQAEGYTAILDGSNADDKLDFRPGTRAALEKGIESPLQMLGFSKKEIRLIARDLGLPNFDKPSQPCLSSRFPYGSLITEEKLNQVHQAEKYLKEKGLREIRVRHHGTVARIEIPRATHHSFLDSAWLEEMSGYFKTLDFHYITLDLQGFRSGSMNETLTEVEKIES